MRRVTFAQLLPVGALAWGTLAFGAVYPWAYWPLAVACLLSGLAGFVVRQSARPSAPRRALLFALAAVAAAILLQIVPLPRAMVAAISPGAIGLLDQLNPAFAAGLMPSHALSVWPRDTWTALALFASFAVLCAGLTRLFSIAGTRRFVEAMTVLGVVVALIGIVQRSFSTSSIYGVWELGIGRQPFGPFANRNHFAGWMVMMLPLTLALLVAGIERGMKGVRPGWRHRVLWLSSPEASRLILIGAAAVVMALSLMLTMSRSGIGAFVLSAVMTGWFVARGIGNRHRQVVAGACVAALLIVVVVWTGPEVLASRFADGNWGELNNRKGAWMDAWSVARDFPLAGTGLNTYWAAALFYQRHEMAYFFAQAHNDYLQLAAEGGLLLTVPALVCVTVFVRDVRRAMASRSGVTAGWLRAGAVSSLVAIAFQETVDFSLQMPGNAALLAAICAIALHEPLPYADERGKRPPTPVMLMPPLPGRLELATPRRRVPPDDPVPRR